MDQVTHCLKCGARRVPVITLSGRTDLRCFSCDDPALKWAESPLMAPEEPIGAAEMTPRSSATDVEQLRSIHLGSANAQQSASSIGCDLGRAEFNAPDPDAPRRRA
jgi:hypothetical protein